MTDKSTCKPVIVLFRRDLRLDDNLALAAAVDNEAPTVPVFILEAGGSRAYGGASLWWLHKSLESLSNAISKLGATLILRKGIARDIVLDLQEEIGATAVYWNRRFDPAGAQVDDALVEI